MARRVVAASKAAALCSAIARTSQFRRDAADIAGITGVGFASGGATRMKDSECEPSTTEPKDIAFNRDAEPEALPGKLCASAPEPICTMSLASSDWDSPESAGSDSETVETLST